MKKISLWFALFASAVAAGSLLESCTKENQKNLSKPSPVGVERTSTITSAADPAIAYIVSGKTGNTLMVMNADGSNQTALVSGSIGLPSWSPDAHSILFVGTIGTVRGMWIVDVSVVNGKPTGSNLHLIPINLPTPNGGRWSPLGDLIVFEAEDQNIYTIPPTGGTPTIVYTSPTGLMPFDPEWSPDASKIVFTEWNNAATQSNLQILDRTTTLITTVLPLTSALIYSPTWSRHGDRIAYTASGINTVTPTANATPVKVTNGSYQTWSPDDSKLAFHGGKANSIGIETYTFSGGAITNLSAGTWPDWRRF